MNATFRQPVMRPAVTRLRLGRLLLLLGMGAMVLIGGTLWLFRTQGHPLVAPITDSTSWPAWLKQPQSYAVPEPPPPPSPPHPPPCPQPRQSIRPAPSSPRCGPSWNASGKNWKP